MFRIVLTALFILFATQACAVCPYDPDCIDNPYGAGSPYSNQKIYVVPSR